MAQFLGTWISSGTRPDLSDWTNRAIRLSNQMSTVGAPVAIGWMFDLWSSGSRDPYWLLTFPLLGHVAAVVVKRSGLHRLGRALTVISFFLVISFFAWTTKDPNASVLQAYSTLLLLPAMLFSERENRWMLAVSSLPFVGHAGAFAIMRSGGSTLVGGALTNLAMVSACIAFLRYESLRSHRAVDETLKKLIVEKDDAQRARNEMSRALDARSKFLATMSHEIRTPMQGVLGALELVRQSELNAAQQELVAIATSSGSFLLTLLNDILDFSKLEAGEFLVERTSFSPQDLVTRVVQVIRTRLPSDGTTTLDLHVDERVPTRVLQDPRRLQQVLFNLLGNAVKFTPRGKIVVEVTYPNGALQFKIQDTGVGIPKESQARIFSDFVQADASIARQYGGTGLGLAISKRLVTAMGGTIAFSSEPGQGTTFTVSLPAAEATAAALSIAPSSAPTRSHKKFRTLLVEDNPVSARILAQMLTNLGAEYVTATGGREAIAKLQGGGFELVLMDLQLPEMDGFEASAEIRKFNAKVPIYALTASIVASDRERAQDVGMQGFLTKPISLDELSSVMGDLTSKAPAPA